MSVVPHPTHTGWWHVKCYPGGKKGGLKVFTLKDCTKEEALGYERALRQQARGTTAITADLPTINEAIPHFLQYYRLDHLPTGIEKMSLYTEYWRAAVGKMKFASLTPELVEHYKRQRLDAGIKPTTINKELSALSSLVKWATEKGYRRGDFKIRRFPAKMTKAPLPDVPTREEVLALIDAMIWPRCGLFACMYYGGLRAGEATTMTAERTSIAHGVIVVRGKGNKERPVPIVDSLRPYLVKRLQEVSKGMLWTTRSGAQITDLKKIIRLARERAGIDRHIYPHLLRHAFGTHATQLGVNLRTLQYAMGHTSSKTTEIYTTLGAEAIKLEITGKFGRL